MYHFYFMLITC